MSLLSVIFNRPKNVQINVANAAGQERELLILDMTRNISHINNATPTDNPIEDGSDITDHIDVDPKTLSFEGIMSEAPITLIAAAIGNVAGAVPMFTGVEGTPVGTIFSGVAATLGGLLLNGQDNRAQEAFNALQQIQDDGILVTIITGLRVYNNMFLASFNPTQTSDIGGSLSFTATFREIRLVQSESVVLSDRVLGGGVKNKASSVQNQGKKVAGGASSETSGRASSILSKITGIGA